MHIYCNFPNPISLHISINKGFVLKYSSASAVINSAIKFWFPYNLIPLLSFLAEVSAVRQQHSFNSKEMENCFCLCASKKWQIVAEVNQTRVRRELIY